MQKLFLRDFSPLEIENGREVDEKRFYDRRFSHFSSDARRAENEEKSLTLKVSKKKEMTEEESFIRLERKSLEINRKRYFQSPDGEM